MHRRPPLPPLALPQSALTRYGCSSTTLESLLGPAAVVPSEQWSETLTTTLSHVSAEHGLPAAVVYPRTEAELAEVMTCAARHQWRVLPCGSGSKLAWGGLASGVDLVVSTSRLNQVIEHAVGDMTLTAQAGLTLAKLAPQLAQVNQFLAVDPAYPEQATLGGLVATGDTGALRQHYGGLRDMLIGITLVRHDGQMARAGGRVVKNVAGYDLMKLLTGSYGTLGVIAQLTFRLYPVQDESRTVVIAGGATAMQALVTAVRLSSLTPVSLDILSPALSIALGFGENMVLAARFQSITPGVEEQVNQLLAMVPPELTATVCREGADQDVWNRLSTVLFPPPAQPGDEPQRPRIVAKVGLRPAEAVPFLAWLTTFVPTAGLARLHASSGLGTVQLVGEAATAEAVMGLRSRCEQAGGYLTLLEAPLALKQAVDIWGYSGNALGLMTALKAEFDPERRLSPGRFVGGL
ncbi:MAG: FAD-binding oxidoreductase [Leptolyngbyaceae cyanobacterium SM2_5_2]|nr:FAD-binding oxidoreductase [Leptolyngbyaceae cyanobacterium SM2_5_2]